MRQNDPRPAHGPKHQHRKHSPRCPPPQEAVPNPARAAPKAFCGEAPSSLKAGGHGQEG